MEEKRYKIKNRKIETEKRFWQKNEDLSNGELKWYFLPLNWEKKSSYNAK